MHKIVDCKCVEDEKNKYKKIESNIIAFLRKRMQEL